MTDSVTQTTSPPDEVLTEGTSRKRLSEAFLDSIRSLDKGKLAELRRCSGRTLAESGKACWFYGLTNRFRVDRYNEEIFFLVATLFAGDKSALSSKTGYTGDFGRSMKALASLSSSSDSIERRFGLLLDSEFDSNGSGEMAFRLRQTVRLLLSKNIAIDWPQLLDDLKYWSHEEKRARKNWARSFYSAPDTALEITPEAPLVETSGVVA